MGVPIYDVDIDMANKDALTVFVNYRVFDYQGRFIGATGVGLSLDAVMDVIKRYQDTYQRDILFLDSTGQITLSSMDIKQPPSHLLPLIQGLKTGDLSQQILVNDNSIEFGRGNNRLLLNTRFI
jgi:hypothetical protein